MKKLIALLMCLLLALPAFSLAEEEKVLNILSWVGYIDDDTLAAFEEETGVRVVWSPMDSIDSMLLKVSEGGGSDYDLILTSDYSLDILRKQGLIQKLDKAKLSNYTNLDEQFLNQKFDPDSEYVVPYVAGCPLIVYDPEKVPFEITGYEDLWNEALSDSVAMIDNARIVGGITLKTMGKSFNETDPAVLAEMKEKLMPLYRNIRTFGDMESYTAVVSGEAPVGFMFTPFVCMAQNDREAAGLQPLTVVYPKEGLGYGIDGFVIPEGAAHPGNAHLMLDYLMRPEVAAHNAEYQMYMCVNKAAAGYLSAQFLENPVVNVPGELLDSAEFIEEIGATETIFQEIYTAFKNQ